MIDTARPRRAGNNPNQLLDRKYLTMTTLISFLKRVFGPGSLAGRRTAQLQAAAQAF
jgi:hypothetical protein